MKLNLLTSLLMLAMTASLHAEPAAAVTAPTPPAINPATLHENASYSLGMAIAADMQKQGLDILPDAFAAGFKDSFTGAKPRLSDDVRRAVLAEFEQELAAKTLAAGEQSKAAGAAYLAANKSKPGVTTTASGLQYRVITEGTGPQPKLTDTVTVHYKGIHLNGKVFDSSYERGEPATFPLNMALKGWTEAVVMMKTGAKWEIVIPAALAYGEKGNGSNVPPNSTLIFEIELLSVKS